MSKHDDHPVIAVHIKGLKHRVECACGWKSKPAKSEVEARKEHAKHVEGK